MMSIKQIFDKGALQYDQNRQKVIPCFDDMYETVVRLIPFSSQDQFSFLDLGAGTGLVSALILNAFPSAEPTLLDISDKMLEKARERFAGKHRITFHVLDYHEDPIPGKYDLVASAMSIHHLADSGKQRLFRKIYDVLQPGGLFVHAELALGATEATEDLYQERWRDHLQQTNLNAETLAVIYERMSYDMPAPLDAQLDWIRAAGFVDVDCFFKYYNFVVYAGWKKT